MKNKFYFEKYVIQCSILKKINFLDISKHKLLKCDYFNKNDFAYTTNNKKFSFDDEEHENENKNLGYYCLGCICECLDFTITLIIILLAMEEEKNKKSDILFKLKLISKIRDFFLGFLFI